MNDITLDVRENADKLANLTRDMGTNSSSKSEYIQSKISEIRQDLQEINANICDLIDELEDTEFNFDESLNKLEKRNQKCVEFNKIFLPYMVMHQFIT